MGDAAPPAPRFRAWALWTPTTKRIQVEDLYATAEQAWREACEELRYAGYEAGAPDPGMPTRAQAKAAGYYVLPAWVTIERRDDDA